MTIDEWKHEFRLRLMQMMNDRKITQDILAKKSGVSKSMISKYVNGKRIPTIQSAINISNAMHVGVEDLIYFDDTIE